jgi:sensor histidine kinase regulating citrate/malate metabolism
MSAPAGEQMDICFTDNGVGIAANHLALVFEKGFSTKSKATNQGIGLHWCANTVNALGGRMRAESAGETHGASLHVVMPLERAAVPMKQVA